MHRKLRRLRLSKSLKTQQLALLNPGHFRVAKGGSIQHANQHIGHMPFLWLGIDDAPGPASLRAHIEKNTIALLSNYEREMQDPPSRSWLGNNSDRDRVRKSGLWNNNHVEDNYDPLFLVTLQRLIEA